MVNAAYQQRVERQRTVLAKALLHVEDLRSLGAGKTALLEAYEAVDRETAELDRLMRRNGGGR